MGFNQPTTFSFLGATYLGPFFSLAPLEACYVPTVHPKAAKSSCRNRCGKGPGRGDFFFWGGLVDDDGPLSKVEPNRYLKPPGGLGETCGFSNVFFYRRNLKGEMEHQRMATKKF